MSARQPRGSSSVSPSTGRGSFALLRSWVGTLLLGAVVLPGVVAAQDKPWAGPDPLELLDPKMERPSTLRVLRAGDDPADILEDQGTVTGYVGAAVQGKIKPRDGATDPEGTIEILDRRETKKLEDAAGE